MTTPTPHTLNPIGTWTCDICGWRSTRKTRHHETDHPNSECRDRLARQLTSAQREIDTLKTNLRRADEQANEHTTYTRTVKDELARTRHHNRISTTTAITMALISATLALLTYNPHLLNGHW